MGSATAQLPDAGGRGGQADALGTMGRRPLFAAPEFLKETLDPFPSAGLLFIGSDAGRNQPWSGVRRNSGKVAAGSDRTGDAPANNSPPTRIHGRSPRPPLSMKRKERAAMSSVSGVGRLVFFPSCRWRTAEKAAAGWGGDRIVPTRRRTGAPRCVRSRPWATKATRKEAGRRPRAR